jgi:hypothetical protein
MNGEDRTGQAYVLLYTVVAVLLHVAFVESAEEKEQFYIIHISENIHIRIP